MAKFSEDHRIQGNSVPDPEDDKAKQPTEPIPVITPEDTPGVKPAYPITERMSPIKDQEPDDPKNSFNKYVNFPWDFNQDPEQNDPGKKEPITANPIVLLILAAVICMIPTLVLALVGSSLDQEEKKAENQPVETVMVAHEPQEKGTYEISSMFDVASQGKTTYHIRYNEEGEDGEIKEQSIELDQSAVTFEASGEDNTITLYEVSFDAVEAGTQDTESPVIVTENAQDPEMTATIHYDPEKRNVDTYGLVSLEKKGNSDAVLTYTEAAGITNTLSISPSIITVEDDGEGIVERIEEYDENGQWYLHWVVHSLP